MATQTHGMFNVRDYGAIGDGIALDHDAIQKAIDRCSDCGGGTVLVTAGTYLCGTIELKSNTILHLTSGATIAGSPDRKDYRKMMKDNQFFTGNPTQPANHDEYLIVAWNANSVGIEGAGKICAQGGYFYEENGDSRHLAIKSWRPGPTVAFVHCRDVNLAGVHIQDHPFFAVLLHGCERVRLCGLCIETNPRFQNADGIHVACTRGLIITQCQIHSQDDALCFYTNYWNFPDTRPDCHDVVVSDCILSSRCCGIRIGFGAPGQLRDMVFNNIVMREVNRGIDLTSNAKNIYQSTDSTTGPALSNLLFTNISIAKANWGITGNITSEVTAPGGIMGVQFRGIRLSCRHGNYLTGNRNLPLREVLFSDVEICLCESQTGKRLTTVPEDLSVWYKGDLPYAFFLRDAQSIAFRNCRFSWADERGEWMGALCAERCDSIDDQGLLVIPPKQGWSVSR